MSPPDPWADLDRAIRAGLHPPEVVPPDPIAVRIAQLVDCAVEQVREMPGGREYLAQLDGQAAEIQRRQLDDLNLVIRAGLAGRPFTIVTPGEAQQ